jgi:hypothetical protein
MIQAKIAENIGPVSHKIGGAVRKSSALLQGLVSTPEN